MVLRSTTPRTLSMYTGCPSDVLPTTLKPTLPLPTVAR